MPTETKRQVASYRYHYTYQVDADVSPVIDVGGDYTLIDYVTKAGPLAYYRQLIANGDNATTSMSGESWTLSLVPGKIRCGIQHRNYPYPIGHREVNIEGNFMFLGVPSFPLVKPEGSADNQALTRYYSNVNSVATKFKGLVFTGELRESLNMIKSPAKGLRDGMTDYLNSARRRVKRGLTPKQITKAIAETWLEYAFGWKPLINDIDSAITAFYQSDAVHPIFEMVKGSGRDESAVVSDTVQVNLGFWYVLYERMIRDEVYVQYRGIYQSSGDGVPDSHTYGFRPAEFVPTLWELIPYSFLADYFTNIGEIVSSWSYRFIGTKWTSKTIRRQASEETIGMRTIQTPPLDPMLYETFCDGSPGYQYIQRKSFARVPSVEPGLPSFEVQVPGRWDQWVNMTALAAKHKDVLELIRQVTRK